MKRIAIIGSTGAIGGAFLTHLLEREETECVYALSRSGVAIDHPKLKALKIDLTHDKSIEDASLNIAQRGLLDMIILATGALHSDAVRPEKSLRDIQLTHLENIFAVNTFGPALVMKYFLPLLNHNQRSVFAALSARVGSTSDNVLGGWYAYRASKAALNMLIKTAAIEIARKNKHAIVVGLHPGTVESALSAPFSGQVSAHKLFKPEFATLKMLEVMDGLSPEQSGRCYAYDGQEIAP